MLPMAGSFCAGNLPARDETENDVLDPTQVVGEAVHHMAAVREAVGDAIQLCLDVHTRLDTANTVDLCRRLEPYRPFFIEDPPALGKPGELPNAGLATSVCPSRQASSVTSKWAFREVVEEELINYARIDLCIVGGLTEALKGRPLGARRTTSTSCRTTPWGQVSAAGWCVALCMATTNVGVQEMPRAPGTFATDVFPQQILWEDGLRPVSRRAPVWGVELDEAIAESRPAPFERLATATTTPGRRVHQLVISPLGSNGPFRPLGQLLKHRLREFYESTGQLPGVAGIDEVHDIAFVGRTERRAQAQQALLDLLPGAGPDPARSSISRR